MDRTVGIVRCECNRKAEGWDGVRDLFTDRFYTQKVPDNSMNKTGLEGGLSAEAAEH
jgi:hypothetical protein